MYRDDGDLGVIAVPAVVGTIVGKLTGGLIKPKSPRYGGGDGPLYSTVNSFIARIVTGDLGVIKQLDQLRKTDADKVQWSLFWNTDMLDQPLTPAQVQLIVQLDPSKAGLTAHSGTPIAVSPSGQVSAPSVSFPSGGDVSPTGAYPAPTTTAGLFSNPLVLGAAAVGLFLLSQGGGKKRRNRGRRR